MKILAMGDFHGKFPSKFKKLANESDLVLSTGDFGGSDKLLKIIFKYFYEDWWEKVGQKKAENLVLEDYNSGKKVINQLNLLKTPVFTIHGNWDFEEHTHTRRTAKLKLRKYSEIIKEKKNLIFLKRQVRSFNGIKVYGFGGMTTASMYLTHKKFSLEKRKKYKKIHELQKKSLFRVDNKDLDILLAHYPPYGYFDVVDYKGGYNPMNGKHVGFKPYTDFIKKYHPRVFVCGHMHEYQGIKKIGKTLVVATGSVKEGKAALIDLPLDKSKAPKIKLIK